jgi:hypothetical protein
MRDTVIRVKGNRAYSSQGNLTSIMDLKSQDLILVDVEHKRFATVPAAQYAQRLKAAVPAMPEQARATLATMKTNLESRDTGRIAAIQGVQSEEHEFVMTIDMPLPGIPQPAGPAPGPLMKIVIQMWTAQPDETRRVPALQEFRSYTAAASTLNPTDMIKQVLSMLPGMGDNLGTMVEEMSRKGAMSMRTHMELSSPFLAVMSQQLPGQALPAGLNPNAPLVTMNQEAVELSTDSIDDALFQVPADYQPASLEEILKGAVTAAPQFKR